MLIQKVKRLAKRSLLPLRQPKYYFVGLTATGNRVAGQAMSLLGFRWKHYPLDLEDLWDCDVATDTPVGYWFRRGLLPRNGIFVLTTRNLEPWLDDCQIWFNSRPLDSLSSFERANRMELFGQLEFDRSRFAEAYRRHTLLCYQRAEQMGVVLHEWNVTEQPNWDFLTELTKHRTNQPFPFQPGVYEATYQAVQARIDPTLS